jgi:hypothetical protein
MKMTTFERKPFDENPYWGIFQTYGSEDVMKDFEDK